jgi:hypothetical protein
MPSTSLHKDLIPEQIHSPLSFSYTDSTEREAATGMRPEDVGKFALQEDDNSVWMLTDDDPVTWAGVSSAGALTADQHKALRHLIHFIDNGPAESFASGAYREMTGTVFPTAIIWFDKAGAGKKKIVEKLITWTGVNPTTIVWKVYDASETLLATVTDTISFTGVFETSRTRTIA